MALHKHDLPAGGELLHEVISHTLPCPATTRRAHAGCSDTQLKVPFSQRMVSPTTMRAHGTNPCH